MRKLPGLAQVRGKMSSVLMRLRATALRGPVVRLMLGAALLIPSVALMSTDAFQGVRPTDMVETSATADPMAAQWRVRVLEQERRNLIARLARTFDVPVTLATEIHDAAAKSEIEPTLAFGLVAAESSFRTRAVSPVGAIGLTQVMPATARDVEPGTTRTQLFDTQTNLRIGFAYLRQMMDRYDGDTELALTAYNRGPGTVDRVLKRGGNPDNGYAEKVLTGESKRHVALMNRKFGGR